MHTYIDLGFCSTSSSSGNQVDGLPLACLWGPPWGGPPATIGKIDHQFSRFDDVLTMKLLGNHCFLIKESIEALTGASNVSNSTDESRE